MVLPILISLSLAPGPYWPAAKANSPARARAKIDSPVTVVGFMVIKASIEPVRRCRRRAPEPLRAASIGPTKGGPDAAGHALHCKLASARQLPVPEITSPNSCQVVP